METLINGVRFYSETKYFSEWDQIRDLVNNSELPKGVKKYELVRGSDDGKSYKVVPVFKTGKKGKPVEVKTGGNKGALANFNQATNLKLTNDLRRDRSPYGVHDSYIMRMQNIAEYAKDPATLAMLAKKNDPRITYFIVSNKATPTKVLDSLVGQNEDFDIMIMRHPNTSPDTLMKLSEKYPDQFKKSALSYIKLPEVLQAKFVDSNAVGYLANNENLSPKIAEKLADHKDSKVRYNLAKNPSTPPRILAKLSEDEDKDVWRAVAINRSTPPEILKKLADNGDSLVKEYLCMNPRIPIEILEKLATDDEKSWIRLAAKQAIAKRKK